MSHPSEEDLARYASEPSSEGHEPLRDHIEECSPCREAARGYDELISTLSTEETWTPVRPFRAAADVASLARFDLQWRRETAEAAALMSDLSDAGPAEWPLDEFPRTPAMVFQMLKRYRSETVQTPRESLRIIEVAEQVAEEISSTEHSADVIQQVFGRIAKDKSVAQRYLGRFEEALASLDRAEALFARLAMPDFDFATVAYNRAQVFSETDEYARGLEAIETATTVFQHLGVVRQVANCRIIRGNLLYYEGQIIEARNEFSLSLDSGDLDRAAVPSAMLNVACCSLELGDFEQAVAGSLRALRLFSQHGNRVEALRARWALARAHLGNGNGDEGLPMLHSVGTEFRELGMLTDAALVILNLVEHFIGCGDHEEASRLCTSALERFVIAGMPAAAASAMAHLRDLAARGEARIADVGEVRATIGEGPGQFRQISISM